MTPFQRKMRELEALRDTKRSPSKSASSPYRPAKIEANKSIGSARKAATAHDYTQFAFVGPRSPKDREKGCSRGGWPSLDDDSASSFMDSSSISSKTTKRSARQGQQGSPMSKMRFRGGRRGEGQPKQSPVTPLPRIKIRPGTTMTESSTIGGIFHRQSGGNSKSPTSRQQQRRRRPDTVSNTNSSLRTSSSLGDDFF